MPNQDESRVSKMSWSMVSKAAERSNRDKNVFVNQEQWWGGCGCIREIFQWNGADGKQIGEDSEDCERKGDQEVEILQHVRLFW